MLRITTEKSQIFHHNNTKCSIGSCKVLKLSRYGGIKSRRSKHTFLRRLWILSSFHPKFAVWRQLFKIIIKIRDPLMDSLPRGYRGKKAQRLNSWPQEFLLTRHELNRCTVLQPLPQPTDLVILKMVLSNQVWNTYTPKIFFILRSEFTWKECFSSKLPNRVSNLSFPFPKSFVCKFEFDQVGWSTPLHQTPPLLRPPPQKKKCELRFLSGSQVPENPKKENFPHSEFLIRKRKKFVKTAPD